ncbi:hypothetical protein Gpo141_00012549 [Globisporangium polare]
MPTRFTVSSPSLSLSHTSGYADLHALQQLSAARGSGNKKKPKALLQRKPRHLEPVNVTNQQQPHLLDVEERNISSKQLRSLVSSAVILEKPSLTSANESLKCSGQQRKSSQERSQVADPVLSRLDAHDYGSGSSAAATAKRNSSSVQERQQRDEEDCESPGSRKHHHLAHVRSLREHSAGKPQRSATIQDTPPSQARMQSMDLSSMHGTTLARYRRLIDCSIAAPHEFKAQRGVS